VIFLRYAAYRLITMVLTLLVVSVLIFIIINLPPGDYLSNQIAELRAMIDEEIADDLEKTSRRIERIGVDNAVVRLLDVVPDAWATDGRQAPALSVYLAARCKIPGQGPRVFAILRATYVPEFVDGWPSFELVDSGVSDLRITRGSGLFKAANGAWNVVTGDDIPLRGLMAWAIEWALAGAHETLQSGPEGVFEQEARQDTDRVLAQFGPLVPPGFDPGDVVDAVRPLPKTLTISPSGVSLRIAGPDGESAVELAGPVTAPTATHAIGDSENAALVVHVYHEHILWYALTRDAFFRHFKDDHWLDGLHEKDHQRKGREKYSVGFQHRKYENRMRRAGRPGLEQRSAECPGRYMLTIYLPEGCSIPSLGRQGFQADQPGEVDDAQCLDWWNDKIRVMQIRPGPKYAGHRLRVFERDDFKRGKKRLHDTLGIGDYQFSKGAPTRIDDDQISSMRVVRPR